jgi:hypothetical protein
MLSAETQRLIRSLPLRSVGSRQVTNESGGRVGGATAAQRLLILYNIQDLTWIRSERNRWAMAVWADIPEGLSPIQASSRASDPPGIGPLTHRRRNSSQALCLTIYDSM